MSVNTLLCDTLALADFFQTGFQHSRDQNGPKCVHFGLAWSILVILGPPTVLWPFLNLVGISGPKKNIYPPPLSPQRFPQRPFPSHASSSENPPPLHFLLKPTPRPPPRTPPPLPPPPNRNKKYPKRPPSELGKEADRTSAHMFARNGLFFPAL